MLMAGYHIDLPRLPQRPARVMDNYGLGCVLRGSAEFSAGPAARQSVRAGQAYLVFPEMPFEINQSVPGPYSEIYVLFAGKAFDLWRDEGLLDPARPVLRLGPPQVWLPRLEEILESGTASGTLAAFRCVTGLLDFLGAALQQREQAGAATAEGRWRARAEALLTADLAARVRWRQISRELHLSHERFRKKFRELTGVSPARFRARESVRRISEILLREDASLKQLASKFGFHDEFHLSKRFKQLVGMSPAEFRKRMRQF